MRTNVIFCGVLVLGSAPAHAWWDAGHLVTAAVAYDNLTPPARQAVDALSVQLQADYPYVNGFLAMATWPDDLKTEGVAWYNPWHYTLIPYNPDKRALPPSPAVNVVWAIGEASAVLDDARSRPSEKARALAFLAHFVGDIHQPLHSTTLFTDALPDGDMGGNLTRVRLPGAEQEMGLHQVWDSACGALEALSDIRPYGTPQQPLTRQEQERIRAEAARLQAAWPLSSVSAGDRADEPALWAEESHGLAVADAYLDKRGTPRLEPGQELTPEYVARCRAVSEQRIAAGGYRLAARLNQIWAF